jgi:membrane-associated protease RseP (regulator of RpoE activity)
MRIKGLVVAALAAAVMLPVAAEAQVFESVVVRRAGSGMIGVATESVRTEGAPARTRVITDVVSGSAAAQAGLVVGDTIVSINGRPATEQVMFAPLQAGDTVVLRVRRSGRERDVTVVAGVRPDQARSLHFTLPDSIERQMSVIFRDVQQNLDSLARRSIRIERTAGDSNIIFRFGGDSVRVFAYPGRAALLSDSIESVLRTMHGDVTRFFGDSARFRVLTYPDSAHIAVFRTPGRLFHADTIRFLNPAEAMTGAFTAGMRAVAGAELTELNPGLAEYFGVMSGVLVINAREGTPAANAGIRAGDVIIRANGTNVTTVPDLRRIMMQAGPRAPVEIRLLRHGQPVNVRIGG